MFLIYTNYNKHKFQTVVKYICEFIRWWHNFRWINHLKEKQHHSPGEPWWTITITGFKGIKDPLRIVRNVDTTGALSICASLRAFVCRLLSFVDLEGPGHWNSPSTTFIDVESFKQTEGRSLTLRSTIWVIYFTSSRPMLDSTLCV